MAVEYSVEACRALAEVFRSARLRRPLRVKRYDPGEELTYSVTGVAPAGRATVRLRVERFVGGGFAGQVYRVEVLAIDGEPVAGLEAGRHYALKILVPPSGFAKGFRDLIYRLGFQGAFSGQVNPDAARAGVLWQKIIRRGAKVRFGTERAVVDVLATLTDEAIGSCGEISEWIEGRNWQFEADDRLDLRRRWSRGQYVDPARLGSPEYRAKKTFMRDFVALLHEMGAPELARQYEWWTCKSTPNVLKRTDADGEADPAAGLTAVDFRAGLALLAVLPMSPGDFKLIFQGLRRGSVVQFDRGDTGKLRRFVDAHAEHFADLRGALDELQAADAEYRDSLVDVSHHHVRLLHSRRLWAKITASAVRGWEIDRTIDAACAARLRRSRFLTILFALVGLVPLLGRRVQKLLGRADYRSHYGRALTRAGYRRRAFRAHAAEAMIDWHRAGRIGERRILAIGSAPWREAPWRFAAEWALSLLPARLHRFVSDRAYAWSVLKYIFARPVRLYFNAEAREQWLREMLADGRRKGMLTAEDAERIASRIKEPFIQKYLKSLAVHVCTLPVTQIVSVIVAMVYVRMHPELSWKQASVAAGAILVAFQVVPISPGSLTRGLYVLYLVIRERNFRDYNIAVFLGFFKYVGYLAFPIQMAYRYPALARFMAGHFATEAAHSVPVFGEHGALMEHAVFDRFYNYPLTVRRRMKRRAERRSTLKPRISHVPLVALAAVAVLAATDLVCIHFWGAAPRLKHIWLVAALTALLTGAAGTGLAGGLGLARRVIASTVCGAAVGIVSAGVNAALAALPAGGAQAGILQAAPEGLWRAFILAILAALGALLLEVNLPEPDPLPQQP